MSHDDEQERRTASIAQAMKAMTDDWTNQVRLYALQAKIARARYDAHRKEGFSVSEALTLCVKPIEL